MVREAAAKAAVVAVAAVKLADTVVTEAAARAAVATEVVVKEAAARAAAVLAPRVERLVGRVTHNSLGATKR